MNLYEEPVGQLADGRYAKYVKLNARDVDMNNHWKLASVFEALQEIAGDQCVGLGFGWQDLMTQYGYCFVIVRMHIEMDEYPGSGENVRVETWPENKLRLVFTRYFRIVNKEGRVIGRAVSNWVLFDMKNRTVVKPQSCPIIQTPDTSSLEPPATMPKHAGKPGAQEPIEEGAEYHESQRVPAYSDFDYNRHVNNARYIEWVQDTLPMDLIASGIRTLDIHYEHEIDFDTFLTNSQKEQSLSIICKTDREGRTFSVSALQSDGTHCFTCTGQLF